MRGISHWNRSTVAEAPIGEGEVVLPGPQANVRDQPYLPNVLQWLSRNAKSATLP